MAKESRNQNNINSFINNAERKNAKETLKIQEQHEEKKGHHYPHLDYSEG
jgi:hypothetical protein